MRKPLTNTLAVSGITVFALCLMTACAPLATYPSVENMETIPTYEPIPTLMAQSIRYTHRAYWDGTGEFAWNLPPGSSADLYRKVVAHLGEGHVLVDPTEPAIHVQSVRTRLDRAEVDVILPREDGVLELLTISYRNKLMQGWRVSDDRTWRIPQSVPAPTYMPPALVVEEEVVTADTAQVAEPE